ncbi:hypothetical protein [Streptomyces sp. NPDC055287]
MPGPSTAPTASGAVPPPRRGHRAAEPPAAAPRGPHPADAVGDVVRWAAFSCALVPVVLVLCGTSFGGAAAATLGLATVTAVCRVLLRRSERAAAEAAAAAHGQARRRTAGAHRGGRHAGGSAPGE